MVKQAEQGQGGIVLGQRRVLQSQEWRQALALDLWTPRPGLFLSILPNSPLRKEVGLIYTLPGLLLPEPLRLAEDWLP